MIFDEFRKKNQWNRIWHLALRHGRNLITRKITNARLREVISAWCSRDGFSTWVGVVHGLFDMHMVVGHFAAVVDWWNKLARREKQTSH